MIIKKVSYETLSAEFGNIVPKWYGFIWDDTVMMYQYYAPIPLNYLIRWAFQLRWSIGRGYARFIVWFYTKLGYYEAVDAAYDGGYRRGIREGLAMGREEMHKQMMCGFEAIMRERKNERANR